MTIEQVERETVRRLVSLPRITADAVRTVRRALSLQVKAWNAREVRNKLTTGLKNPHGRGRSTN